MIQPSQPKPNHLEVHMLVNWIRDVDARSRKLSLKTSHSDRFLRSAAWAPVLAGS
jgi:hypothetical protein